MLKLITQKSKGPLPSYLILPDYPSPASSKSISTPLLSFPLSCTCSPSLAMSITSYLISHEFPLSTLHPLWSASEVARMEDYLYYLLLGLGGGLICVLLLYVWEMSPKIIKMIRRWRGRRKTKRGGRVRFQKQSPKIYLQKVSHQPIPRLSDLERGKTLVEPLINKRIVPRTRAPPTTRAAPTSSGSKQATVQNFHISFIYLIDDNSCTCVLT